MTRFILRRLLLALPALFGLLVLTFIMLRVLPSDPSAALAGENATPEQIAAVRKAYGFDEPLWKQFVIYVGQVGRADFGNSIISNRPVVSDISWRLPATIELTFASLLFAHERCLDENRPIIWKIGSWSSHARYFFLMPFTMMSAVRFTMNVKLKSKMPRRNST